MSFYSIQKSLLDQIGQAYRPEFDGSQDHDMVLRLTERQKKLYTFQRFCITGEFIHSQFRCNLDSKSYAVDAAIHAVSEQLERTKEPGRVESNLPYRTIYRVHYEIPDNAGVLFILHGAERTQNMTGQKKRFWKNHI